MRNSFINKIRRKFFYYQTFRSLLNASQEIVDPYAFIRVHNEIHTVKASLSSIEGIITKGVIGYHECTDGTEEYILDFCKRNKGFIPYKYDSVVWTVGDPRYFDDIGKSYSKNRLDYYYNEILEQIPDNEWFIKIDCDQIYDRELLLATLRMPKNEKEVILLPRINMHYMNDKIYILRNMPLSIQRGHWLLYKTKKLKFTLSKGINNGQRYAWELLDLHHLNWVDTEVMHWHFPLMKSRRSILIDKKDLILLEDASELLFPYRKVLLDRMINDDYILNSLNRLELRSW